MGSPDNVIPLILFAVYYIAIGALAILSLFGVFILSAHGRSRVLSLLVSLVYIFFFLTMLGATEVTLHSIF
jgi:hypothetical protein